MAATEGWRSEDSSRDRWDLERPESSAACSRVRPRSSRLRVGHSRSCSPRCRWPPWRQGTPRVSLRQLKLSGIHRAETSDAQGPMTSGTARHIRPEMAGPTPSGAAQAGSMTRPSAKPARSSPVTTATEPGQDRRCGETSAPAHRRCHAGFGRRRAGGRHSPRTRRRSVDRGLIHLQVELETHARGPQRKACSG